MITCQLRIHQEFSNQKKKEEDEVSDKGVSEKTGLMTATQEK